MGAAAEVKWACQQNYNNMVEARIGCWSDSNGTWTTQNKGKENVIYLLDIPGFIGRIRANLREAILFEADASKANFRGAVLRGANLREINLNGANLSGTDLSEVYFGNADLRAVSFGNAKVDKGTNFMAAKYDSSTQWPTGFVPPDSAIKLD